MSLGFDRMLWVTSPRLLKERRSQRAPLRLEGVPVWCVHRDSFYWGDATRKLVALGVDLDIAQHHAVRPPLPGDHARQRVHVHHRARTRDRRDARVQIGSRSAITGRDAANPKHLARLRGALSPGFATHVEGVDVQNLHLEYPIQDLNRQ